MGPVCYSSGESPVAPAGAPKETGLRNAIQSQSYEENGVLVEKGTYNMGKQCGDWFVKGKPKTCLSRPCWPQRRKLDPKVPPLPASSGAGLPSDLLTVFCLSGAPRLSCGSGEGRGRMRACIKTNQ